MDRKNIEQYLGRNVEIMLMPDGHKTSGVLLRCEDELIALGNESGEALFVYPMIWGISPLKNDAPIPKPSETLTAEALFSPSPVLSPKVATASVPVPEPENAQNLPEPSIVFLDELEECFDELEAELENFSLNADYVRKFKTDRKDKVQIALESILTKYSYAVRVHEDRPYSMRMRQIASEAKNLWEKNRRSITAAEIYGFILYLMGENSQSVKIYMGIHDFRAAFTASTAAASRMLAAACLIVSEPMNAESFSLLLKLEAPQIIALLRWVMENSAINEDITEEEREICFKYTCAICWKILGFSSWPDKDALFTPKNIEALSEWLGKQKYDVKIVDDAIRLSDKADTVKFSETSNLRPVDWEARRFEGELDYFNISRDKLYGFIKCPGLKKYGVPLRSECSVFVHLNQIEDIILRRKLLTGGNNKPMIKVTFKLGNNVEGPAAYEVREKANDNSGGVLSVDMMSALSEEGVIDFFIRYNDPPFGKILASDKKLYSFNEGNLKDPVLAVFLEVDPSPDGLPVRFTKSFNDSGKVQVRNIEAAVPFPEDKVKAWEESGLVQKARERLHIVPEKVKDEPEPEPEMEEELSPEAAELIARGYVPLEPYTPETGGVKFTNSPQRNRQDIARNETVGTFSELPKFLQDIIMNVSTASVSTEYLTDTHYSKGYYQEVHAKYLSMLSRFNNDDMTMTNAERAERCFLMARYVYNFFAFADNTDKRQYPASEEDNIRIMAYKGLEYLIYSQLDGASRNEGNYDTARRYCLLRLADEIQEAGRIDSNNTWLKIYIYSYFVNGLRFHSATGKWSAQGVSLSGRSLLECNDFGKFFGGLLTLAYVSSEELVIPTLKVLLHSPEYSGRLLEKLGLDESVYSQKNVEAEITASFKKALEKYENSGDILIQDAEVKLSPEFLRILSVQKMIIRLMKKELPRIFHTTPERLDDVLRRTNPTVASEGYAVSLSKTKQKYNPDAGLLDVLPISALGGVMRNHWADCFGAYFGGKPYGSYWKDKFAKLQWVRDPVFHAHPEYITDDDIKQAREICAEITECLHRKI